jgi:hypothetical protein
MRDAITIRSIRFTPAPPGLLDTGLIGWASLRYGGLELDGIAVRRTRDGRHVLSFPENRRRPGPGRLPVRPAGNDVRAEIEAVVLAELRQLGVVP